MEPLRYFITPNDADVISGTDSESIQRAVDLASSSGLNRVVIPRVNARTGGVVWSIEKAILLPSDIHILLDGCHLRMADGVFDNFFRNVNMYLPEGRTDAGEQKNIRITGTPGALLDGGEPNGLIEKTSGKNGFPHIIWNNMILLHNVRDFELSGFEMTEPRWWCVNLIYCRYGRLSNLKVNARDNIPNQDGIDLRSGCNNIIIENITGQGGDDLIALTGFQGFEIKEAVEGRSVDIHTVVIRGVVGSSVTKAIVALRNQDGVKLYNILIDGIMDSSAEEPGNSPYAALRIGQNAYVHLAPNAPGDTYNITARNIHSCRNTAILVNSTLINSDFTNIKTCAKGVCCLSTHGGAYLDNVTVDGVYFTAKNGVPTAPPHDRCGTHSAIFNFEHHGDRLLGENDRADNVYINNVFADEIEHLVYASGNAKLLFSGVHIRKLTGEAVVAEDGAEVGVQQKTNIIKTQIC